MNNGVHTKKGEHVNRMKNVKNVNYMIEAVQMTSPVSGTAVDVGEHGIIRVGYTTSEQGFS